MTTVIRNIVLSSPEGEWRDERWQGPPRDHALFYADLLGMRLIREDWLVVAADETTLPRIAFGDGPTPDRVTPKWGDPGRPQQVHLDVEVPDLGSATGQITALGATLLQTYDDHMTFADPGGHQLCLYPGGDAARVARVVFDCFSPRALAGFWSQTLSMSPVLDTPERVEIAREDRAGPSLGFRHVPGYTAPRWPDPRFPQQMHLDLHVTDPQELERVEALGAMSLRGGGSCPVYADPAGHPFCMCRPGQ